MTATRGPLEAPDVDVDIDAAADADVPAGATAPGATGATAGRARDGLEHLQAAARELIAAARAALDVAEDIVDDPSIVKDLTEARPTRSPRPSPSPASSSSSPSSGTPGVASWLEGMASMAGAFGTLGDLIRTATSARSAAGDRRPDGHGPGAPGANGTADPASIERIVVR